MSNPVAKTFYSHRVFLVYQPDDYREYLIHMVDKRSWSKKPEADQFQLQLGLLAWGTILVYRARMVPFDFNQELKRLVDEKGRFHEDNAMVPLSRRICRLQLAMQLGIEAITRRQDVVDLIAARPLLAQYIYDALYWTSYLHEKGLGVGVDEEGNPEPFELSQEKLRQHLWFRAQGDSKEKPPKNYVPADVMDVLFRRLDEYISLLARPRLIRTETLNYARQLEKNQRLWIALAEAIDTQDIVSLKNDARKDTPGQAA
jgi:hypothetical protein